jgi:hypothetical protein
MRLICIRAEPGKPAKEKADVMQGEKERTCELLFRPCSHTACDCGLEGGDRRQQGWRVLWAVPECPEKKTKDKRQKTKDKGQKTKDKRIMNNE